MAGFYVQSFGCRASQADGAAIEAQFRKLGLQRSAASTHAKIVVLNTCTVTGSADRDARAAIRKIHRENPDCQIVVTGCYAQRAPAEIAAIPGVNKVVGNSHKHRLAEIAVGFKTAKSSPGHSSLISISEMRRRDRFFVSDIFAHTELLAAAAFDAPNERTRPNLKVQDGCDNRCSFCVIPYVRGQSRSLPAEDVLRQMNVLVSAGYREAVISGINLGRWGRDLAQTGGPIFSFENLVRKILNETSLQKLRISSVEPMDWSDELIAMMAGSSRIAKHAHVPMQSGSDRILRLMHRKYRPWHYREKIDKIRAAMPDAAIGADVMVGFPGETETDFDETRRMIDDLPLTYLHVFTYSSRPGTGAATMPHQVPVHTARERNRILRQLGGKKKAAFMRSFAGRRIEAITLNETHETPAGWFTGALTDNFLELRVAGEHLPNRIIQAQVSGVEGDRLVGALQESYAGSLEP